MADLEKSEEKVETKVNTKKVGTAKNKNNKNEKEEHSRILEYLASEHKWENYLLLFLSLFALVLGCLIINGTLTVNDSFPLIGNFPTVFAWILIGLASVALLLSMYPFFKPAFPEFKKITWMRPKAFGADTIRVFTFLIILVGLFLLYDAFISKLVALIIS